ncbi:MAG: protein kinase [Blastocatellales bacterium]
MSETLAINSTISHYRIVSKLGAGGMGEVWLAEDTRLKRKVALKLLPAELTADADRVRRFEQEAQAASALNHPNIVTVHDIGECEAGRFIVMELVAGRTLRAVIAEDNSLETLLTLGQQMARALSAAHAAGITHRDIKPDNIMVRDDGYVKVLDFGLARLLPATASGEEAAALAQQTTPGAVLGTVAYMSPEQASGQSVGHPSDIFALGIALYELATGRHPFKAETLVGYLHAITLQTPPSLTSLKPEIPAALNTLILQMLSKDASQRPTAGEVARGLQELERRGASSIRDSAGDVSQSLEASLTPGSVDIAHVLFCDIVGYSILPIDRQKKMISALQEIVRQTEDYRRAAARGQLVRLPAGDGMALAFLQDPVAPVRCAIEIGRALKSHPEIRLRMGVHSGPVFLSTDINGTRNVVGSGINMAQRVMDSGDAGHILVSRNVAEVLGQISHWQPLLHDLGEREVKHGVRIHLFNLFNDEVGNAATPQKLLLSQNENKAAPPSLETDGSLPVATSQTSKSDEGFWVAVLPFKYRGANADLEALAEGLSEDIVTGLSRFSYLRVIARGSTLRYASDSGDVRAIGKELGARYVMEGSLRQAGSTLRVAAQLVNASTGAHLWTETYTRAFSPEAVFEIQDDLVPRIVSTVADWYGALPHSMSEAVRLKAPDQLTPYEAVLRSFGYFERIAPEEHAVVRAGLERAVEQAPGNADGWAMLSMLYGEEHRFGFNAQPDPLGRALEAARRAVNAAHANHFAWLALAQALFFRKEFVAFRDAAGRAIALNPMDGSTLEYLAHLIAFAGDWERGCELAERARQLNPNHPGWYWAVHFLDAYRKGDYQNARYYMLKYGLRGDGAQLFEHSLCGAFYGQVGEWEEAGKLLQTVLAAKPDFALTVRDEFAKWYLPELVEQLMDGLRKAGLEELQTAETAGDSTGSGSDLSPLDVRDSEVPGRSRSPYRTEASASIAVLPFANISADEENEYFCDGLAEELLNALAKIDALKVAARTSAFSFKGKNAEAREIGKTLNVNTVLEGSVRKAGSRIRINVQLVNAADGYQLWSERYDREMKDIFDVQDEITLAVVDALKVKLLGEEKSALLKRHTSNADAYEFYLRGLSYFNRWTPDDFQKAIESFCQAIAIDPCYASAYAALSNAYTEMAFFSFSPPDEWMPKAKEATSKALDLDDTLAEAHNSLAIIKMYYDRDYAGAEREFTRARALDPGSAHLHMWYGWYLGVMARFDEGLKVLQQAWELDSLSGPINFGIGSIFHWSRQPERAIERFRKILELNPNYAVASSFLAEAYEQQGDFVSALATIERLQQTANDPLTLSTVGYVYAKSGDQHKAREILNELERRSNQGYVAAPNFAHVYAGLGDREQALAWLDKACNERSLWMTFLKVDPKFDLLRSDPRFAGLLRRIGLLTEEKYQTDESLEANTMRLATATPGKQSVEAFVDSATPRHTVGREHERNELRTAFKAANDGRGSLVCVAGEPGIGKTTLVEDFLTELTTENQCTIARGRCSERLAGTEAYLPLLEALESLLAQKAPLGVGQDLILPYTQKMKQLAPTWYAQVAPLSGDSEESAHLLAEVKAASQERMKRELAAFLQAVAMPQPLVIFFDDLHWADVSTIDLLSFLAGKFDALRVLIVVTYRPSDMLLSKHPFLQIKPDLQARGLCRELLLEFLTEAEIADYLALEFPRHAFPPDFARMIHAKTEGSPLFMADLARYLRDRNVIAQTSGAWKLEQTLPDIERELPESVRGMIERKMAQLSEDDCKLLTVASVQGYEFDSAVVAQVLKLDADEVEERLEKLERVFAFVKLASEAEFPNGTLTLKYRFVHVLYQNALYASLRATRKATLSRDVAQTLEGFYGEQRTNVANELAALNEAGREYARAAEYYRLAAEHATRVFAWQEAVQLARRGLGLLKSAPDTTARTRQELALQVTLSVPLGACRGLASEESRELFARARELAQQLGDPPELWTIMVGQWRSYLVGGDNNMALKLAEEFLPLVRAKAPAAMIWGHQMMVSTFNYRGEFTSACVHTKEMLAIRNPQPQDGEAVIYAGENPVMIGLFMGASSLWNLGYPDQALQQSRQALALARQNGSPFGLALATFLAAELHISRREDPRVREMAEECLALSTEHGFPQWMANGYICRGWALVAAEADAPGLAQMREGITAMHGFEADLGRSRYLALLGEACAATGQIAEGLSLLAEALAFAEQYGERFFEAEIYRLRGELLLKSEAPQAEVEECFHQAIKIAQRQQAKSPELRATMSLARLWRRQGRIAEAQQRLAEIYGWFTEGFDTADLKDAKALLAELEKGV